ncbi:Asp-tRNA(Asn)/Glu-tRNA(Gln) amidotransferase subunit GatB [Pajaroellobacter abortibovis]|uniref:Aspartyl/glutamyl-tRNA(Asn/Gln) amidotransferase subunit B n=1 Tax=Pajaroellobacter abortibovis TaxID=1882918 RepID=A0A1L6MX05_9BACT|nr:Asp-tRNA(Asn)/Glu-tRNA(Gln) amidotransferase subunit GatB [Pajaroellobacter abortibovis]APS00052.1 aspartyl/glutamyl-tRNA amidotransferase subunit B [Pajaroellobacter abortibovis]
MTISNSDYETTIGLEVHAQLLTQSKAFCSCSTAFGAPCNTHACPVCLGLPGALPILNQEAVHFAIRAALALHCKVHLQSRFSRKNYFYPDLPKGYQISQHDKPISEHGWIDLEIPKSDEGSASSPSFYTKRARINRLHMEEDAGKNVHDRGIYSWVDLNRAGVPLIEIVSEPDMQSSVEAVEYLRSLRELLMFLGINDGNLEEGSFRCDVNISLRKRGDTKLGTRVELKNINSFRFVQKAIEYEVERQKEILESREAVIQETRGWDEKKGLTFSMRKKEETQDYRYFPDPDLPPLLIEESTIEEIRAHLPELPSTKRTRFVNDLGLTPYAAKVLTQHPQLASFFEEAICHYQEPVKIGNFIQTEVLRDVVTKGLEMKIPISATQVAELIQLVEQNTISGKQAKELYSLLQNQTKMPSELVKKLGMSQVSDEKALTEVMERLIEQNPKQAAAIRNGKHRIIGFFVGAVMKETNGRANPLIVQQVIKKLLYL